MREEEREAEESLFTNYREPASSWKDFLSLGRLEYYVFICCFLGWTLDMFDSYLLPLTIPKLALEFNTTPSSIAFAITLTKIFKPIGALFWGTLGDTFGYKRVLMVTSLLFGIFSSATGFSNNIIVLYVLRSLYGFCMGGEWGIGSAMIMETLPTSLRGFFSGIYQAGTYVGFLLATVAFRFIVPALGWRCVYYIGFVPSLLVFFMRMWMPESPVWVIRKKHHVRVDVVSYLNTFWIQRIIYLTLVITFMSFVVHGLIELYPTMLTVQLGFNDEQVALVVAIQWIGATLGAAVLGSLSFCLSRKTMMIVLYIGVAGFLYPYLLGPNLLAQMIGAGLLHFFAAGVGSPLPAYLTELSPPGLRGMVPGFAFNLGQLITSPNTQLEAYLAERLFDSPNYSMIMLIFSSIGILLTVLTIYFGPDNKPIDFMEEEEDQGMT